MPADYNNYPTEQELAAAVVEIINQTPQWTVLPGYSINNNTISIAANGRYYYDARVNSVPAQEVTFTPPASGQQRFDALVYDLDEENYRLITGTVSDNPATPQIQALRQILVAYILISEVGADPVTPPSPGQPSQSKNLYNFVFDNYDLESAPVVFRGAIGNIAVIKPNEIASYSFKARLDSTLTYTNLASEAALNNWINSNVLAATVWELAIVVVFAGGFNGETSLSLSFTA